ncbi:signal peptidase I [Aquibacillus salsiterrae]|uniref:Signal peptidase I n=1 Tax=Aquibacillus salsiterrae TaxID=2950439 RepID=A0A9X3WEI5_9BACI|nr:signal peptidase I [Aquibacillus salsiterrae]MDC3417243.1 signal peptidase I [Aquibacillus salsiterrae]
MKKIRIWPITRTVIIAVILAFFFRSYLFASYIVEGKSMEPTLHDGNLLMVNKLVKEEKKISRFDVIVFHANATEDYVKRVIGKPGDNIVYKDDQLFLNGEQINEAYLDRYRKNDGKPLTDDFTLEEVTGQTEVPEGKLFVLGDNRRESLDSRYFGFIDIESVVGKVDIRYWPVTELGFNFKN